MQYVGAIKPEKPGTLYESLSIDRNHIKDLEELGKNPLSCIMNSLRLVLGKTRNRIGVCYTLISRKIMILQYWTWLTISLIKFPVLFKE